MRLIRILVVLGLAFAPVLMIVTPKAALAAHTRAYQTGYDEGYPQGYTRGYHDGSEGRRHHYHPPDGYDDYTQGLHDGRHDGYSEGYRDGRNGVQPRY